MNIVYLKDHLREDTDFSFLTDEIEDGKLILDFSGVKTVDSLGLRNWILTLDQSKILVIYKNCPTFLVSQFDMIPHLVKEGVHIESFELPFICYKCDKEFSMMVETAKDIVDYKTFDPEDITPPKFDCCGDSAGVNCEVEVDYEEVESYDWIHYMSPMK